VSPTRPDADARRETILAAALRVFAGYGFAGATLKSIAQAAGLGSAAHLYYYFPRKEELFGAVLVRYLNLEPLFEESDRELPLDEGLDRYLRRYLAQAREPERALAIHLVSMEGARLLTMGLDLSGVDFAGVYNDLEAHLADQQARGRLRADVDPGHAARAVLGVANFYVQTTIFSFVPPVTDDDVVVRHALDILLRGIAPDD
jgi:TetR/AcrR family transcriptional regulator